MWKRTELVSLTPTTQNPSTTALYREGNLRTSKGSVAVSVKDTTEQTLGALIG